MVALIDGGMQGVKLAIGIATLLIVVLGIEEVIADSPVFKDLPFRPGTRELLLQGRLPKMLWPFYALSLTYKQLRLGRYVGVEQ